MPHVILLFFTGILSSLLFSKLPRLNEILISLFCCLLLCLFKNRYLKYLACIGFGCSWALIHAHYFLSGVLPRDFENHPVCIEGYISSIPDHQLNSTSFNFLALKIQERPYHGQIHLNCYHCPYNLQVGDSWRFIGKLKRPHALMNPASFDLEQYYFQNHLNALGSIVKDHRNRHLTSSNLHFPIQRFREYLSNKVLTKFGHNAFCGITLALSIGLTSSISTAQWQVFRATGTNHLVAISGLHIGLVAGMFSKLMSFIWGRLPNAPLVIPTPYIKVVAGMIAAMLYSILAGLSPSTQRALIMVCCLMFATLSQRYITTFRALILALGGIILLQPFAILGVGFWLSFVAVSLLIYGMNGRITQSGIWWNCGRAQWVVSIGMLPTVLWFFQQASLIAIPANMIAIPWISFLVVPSCLIGMLLLIISPTLGANILQVAFYLLEILWYFLEKMAELSPFIFQKAFVSNIVALYCHIAAYVSLLPQGLIYRSFTFFLLLPFLSGSSPLPARAIKLVVFDVGQGLAVMVRTTHHNLLFDTGAKLTDNFDMGKMVIVPYLRKQGIKKIDVLTISHGDNDHIGGAQSILQSIPVAKIITSVPQRFKSYQPLYCTEKMVWQWDGITFQFLSPSKKEFLTGNNGSCVLKISNGKQSLLLTGDIEKTAEQLLLARYPHELASTILVAPHHGSKTSSTSGFLQAVLPKFAIFSCGYLNNYHHPHLDVIKRYQKMKISLLNTVFTGAITMTLLPDSDKVMVQAFRKEHQKFWHEINLRNYENKPALQ